MLLNNKNCSNCGGYYDSTLEQCPHCHKDNELYAQRSISRDIVFFSPIAQIGMFLAGFAYGGMIIAEIIATLFFQGITDAVFKTVLILLVTYLLMFVGLMAIAFTTRRKTFISKFKRPFDYLYGLGYAGLIILVSVVLSVIISKFYNGGDNSNQATAVAISKNYPILAFFILGLLGPICEEMAYRVGLYSFLRRFNVFLAIGVTVIAFTLIHFDFFAEDMISELWSLPSYILCGLILTIAYEHRGPACSMAAHILYNIFAFFTILWAK